ncbi:MAG: hypothetical protein KF686_15180 [Ramlibacter sp.]|nr:hypothetical protein [Ramlibacter sp.]
MKDGQFKVELEAMVQMKGLEGCALVDAETGMVLHAAGQQANIPQVAEASVDYWRLYERQRRHLDYLGDLRAQVLMHSRGRITIVSCGHGALLIALSDDREAVDWKAWQAAAHRLKALFPSR